MLELVDVGFDKPEVAAVPQFEIDFFADKPAHQHLQIGENVAELQNLRPQIVWRREKARSCRTRPAARLAFCLICMMSLE